MNISIPESLREFVESQVRELGYNSTSEYVRELIRDARCVFRGKVDTHSDGSWTAVPSEGGHRFRGKLDGHSERRWTPIPTEGGHRGLKL